MIYHARDLSTNEPIFAHRKIEKGPFAYFVGKMLTNFWSLFFN